MAKKSANNQKSEAEQIAEFAAQQRQKRIDMVKRVGVIILCVFLVIAFCMPAVGLLF